jgi:hypothetical protein
MGGTFPPDPDTVVTTETVLSNGIVNEVRGFPAIGRVAIGTNIAADDMPGPFTRYHHVVVATHAGANDLAMIDPNGLPVRVPVTVLTQIARANMVITLTRQRIAIVAGGAT